jgi:TRAP-type C4-dicarboxylate transport system permease small subunit
MIQTLDYLNARITRALLAAAAAIIFCLGFLVCADIFGRAIFNSPVKGTPEVVSMSIVIICFLLAGYAVQSGSMIYTNVFSGLFGVRGDAFARLLSALLGILFFGLIVWGSYEPTLHAWASGEYEGEGALRVPVWPARVAVIVGSALVVVSYALLAVHAVCSLVTGHPDAAKPAASTHL